MKSFYILLLLLFIVFLPKPSEAQTNDSCVNALLINVGTSCVPVSYSSVNATAEGTSVAPNPNCGSYKGADVWFKTVVPATGFLRLEIAGSGGFNPVTVLYSGSCGAFTQIVCNANNNEKTINDTALAGELIYIRVFNNNNANGGNFTLCLWEPPVPANDHCADATPLVVGTACQAGNYTNAYATAEHDSVAPEPPCGAYRGGDVWFTLTVPASGDLRIEVSEKKYALYTGSCGSFTLYQCIDGGPLTIRDTALAGETLYIRIFSWLSEEGGPFAICVFEPPVPPNDYCTDAIPLPVDTACTPLSFTNAYATAEGTAVAPEPSCGAYRGGDVWFTFTMPASGDLRIEVTNKKYTLYTGSCGAFSQYLCIDGGAKTIRDTSLSEETIYLRVFSWLSADGGPFTVCLWEPPVPPNDYCTDAIPLPVDSVATPMNFTNAYATAEGTAVAPEPSCGAYRGGDVWFTFTFPASGDLRIDVTNKKYELYTGSCGTFSQYLCIDGGPKTIRDTSLSGETIYLRVFSWLSADGGPFSVYLWEPPVPPNDYCTDAIPLPVDSVATPMNFTNAFATAEGTAVAPEPSCGAYRGGDVWFTFTFPASGDLRIDLTNKRYVIYTGTCGSFTEYLCVDGGARTIRDSTMGGVTVFLRVFTWLSADGGPFSVYLWEPPVPPNDYCTDAIPLPVDNVCIPQTFTNAYATAESTLIAANPGCGYYRGGDVWFTFTMPVSGDLRIEVNNKNFALYQGSCGSFTEYECSDDGRITISDTAIANEILYLRVFTWLSAEGGPFSICIWEPVIPLNDDCVQALSLEVHSQYDPQYYSNAFATAESTAVAPLPSCGNYQGGDVWFRFTVPPTGKAVIKGSNVSSVNTQKVVYTGSCGNFTALGCNALTNIFVINNPGLAGTEISLRCFNYGNEEGGTFRLDVFDTTCNSVFPMLIYDTITAGDSYTFPDGSVMQQITASLTDTSHFTTATFCDSLVVTYLFVLPPLVSLSGQVFYDNDAFTPLQGARVYLSLADGSVTDSTFSNPDGYFSFDSLPAGQYQITAGINTAFGGINATDALRILQHVVSIQPLQGLPRLAADVNLSNTITSADALLVAKRTVGLINSFTAGDWLVESSWINLVSDTAGINLHALCIGDVNRSYLPGSIRMSPPVQLIREGIVHCSPGSVTEIPVSLNRDAALSALTLGLEYPAALTGIVDVSVFLPDAILHYKDGRLSLAWYSLEPFPVAEGEPFLIIKAMVNGTFTATTDFVLTPSCEFSDPDARPLTNISVIIPVLTDMQTSDPEASMLQVYPNPADEALHAVIHLPEGMQAALYLDDLTGNHHHHGIASGGGLPQTLKINTKLLSNGLYYLRLQPVAGSNLPVITRKIMVLH